jgi:thiol-disulfide isomerase/thioredoxin
MRLVSCVFALAIGLGALAAYAQEPLAAPEAPRDFVGRQAPPVKLPLLSGGTLDTEAYRGEKYVVLDFWTTWCPWCRESTDTFVELSKQYADQDIAFYMVSVGEKEETVARYFERNKIEAEIALDTDRAVSDQYLVDYIPHIVLMDKEGQVLLVSIGKDQVAEQLTEKLAELFPAEDAAE